MTIRINHYNAQKTLDLQIQLVQHGIADQHTARLAAEWIITNRVTAWKGLSFVHYD